MWREHGMFQQIRTHSLCNTMNWCFSRCLLRTINFLMALWKSLRHMCQTSAISILLGLHVGLANPNHILNSHSFEPSPNPLLQHQVSQGLGSHQPCSPPRKTMLKYALMKNNNNVISACAFFALVFGLVYTCNRNSIHGVAKRKNKSISFEAREKKMTTMKKTTEYTETN